MPLILGSPEAEAKLAEKRARDDFLQAKLRRANAEEIEQKRDAWIKASQNRKEHAANPHR